MNKKIPPKLAERILEKLLRDDLAEEVLGDLEEKFYSTSEKKSHFKAKLNYWYQTLNYLRPFAIKKSKYNHFNQVAMIKNYSKIAWRSLLKNKVYSTIKIGGFAIGIAACILISMYVFDELNFDKNYKNKDQIYRLINHFDAPGDESKWTAFPAEIASVLKNNFPDIDKAGRLIPYTGWWNAGSNQFRPEKELQNTYEEGFAYADQNLLEILEVDMIYGDQLSALIEPMSIVISKKKADKYFPNQNPVGVTVILNGDTKNPYHISGVMRDFPTNSHLNFDFFITLSEVEFWPGEQTSWCCWNYNTYISIRPETDKLELEEKLLLIRDNYIVKYAESRGDQGSEDTKKYHKFKLQNVSDIRLKSEGIYDVFPHGDIKLVWLFAAIASFILVLACINFINLSTAKSANRAKEVGLRKVVGSFRSNLIQQFLTESIIFSGISVIIGSLLAWLALPFFNSLAGKMLSFPIMEWWVVPLLIIFIVFIGIIAGIYPSFYLSSFKPIDVLKGSISRGSKSTALRSGMVVFQFTTSIVLIVGAFVVYQQMDFLLSKKLGFEKDQVIMIQGANTLNEKLNPFKNELLNLAEVRNASASDNLPVAGTARDQNMFWKAGRSQLDKGVGAQIWWTDSDYISTLGMSLIEGRNFSMDMASDSSSIIINQSMAKELGLTNPIGKKIMNWRDWTVIGVVEDFHFESLKSQKIEPLSFVRGEAGSILSVKVNSNNMEATLKSITSLWDEFMPNQPIRYSFLDQAYAEMYEEVQRTGNVFTVFAFLAILVACLGLFGLSAFMAEQRRKEICIRKVLGATFDIIFRILTLNFLKLVFISLIISIPIGYLMMNKWLQDFEYRINIGWEVFVAAGTIVSIIALFTVSFESVRAALGDPVKGLRSD